MRLFFFCVTFSLKFLLKLAALLEQFLKILHYYFDWLFMIWTIRHGANFAEDVVYL